MKNLEALIKTVERLRAPGGCPWDREQTHASICKCLVEETAEFIETVDLNEDAHMCEELGDLLLQVLMHAQIAKERGAFTLEDVAAYINDKMIRRHPHVFGNVKAETSDAVLVNWDKIKAKEKNLSSKKPSSEIFKDLPKTLNNILKADAVWKTVVKKELDPAPVVDKAAISQAAGTISGEEAGKKLFEIIAACRQAKIDPDEALRQYSRKVCDACEKNHGK
ncbi:MAG: MazG family protein [Opitutales bacterium]|nr:MazG family protein [Opitutales bacterium]